MNKTLDIVSDLIDFLAEYTNKKGNDATDIKDFTLWLSHKLFEENQAIDPNHGKNDVDMEFTFLLIMQSKYYKTYCKKALADTDIKSPDEYSFLYHLSLVDSFRKMELINIHLLEAPSGIEVIKRLLKKGFIEEFDDKEDKRAKRIRITEAGRRETVKLTPQMNKVYKKMSADISIKEKQHVVSFLRKLNNYHSENK